jgi:hypothetical protein
MSFIESTANSAAQLLYHDITQNATQNTKYQNICKLFQCKFLTFGLIYIIINTDISYNIRAQFLQIPFLCNLTKSMPYLRGGTPVPKALCSDLDGVKGYSYKVLKEARRCPNLG